MNLRQLSVALLAVVPALAAIGCAENTSDNATSANDDLSVSGGIGFSAAVGVVELGGKELCAATLVDVDANAKIGSVSASGRQIVLGNACLGSLGNGYTGGAVFVTASGGAQVHTPIAAVNINGSAGVGLLAAVVPGVKPLQPYQGGGGGSATLLRNQNGKQVGASVAIEVGVDFELKTKCADLQWKSEVGASVSVAGSSDDSFALVSVNGELQFAASVDVGCVVRNLGNTIETIVELPLDAADAIINGIADIGAGNVIATYSLASKQATVAVYFYEPASELRLNAVGDVSATTQVLSNGKSVSCEALLGSCTLRPDGGFKAGELINVTIDATGGLFSSTTTVLASVP